jgi:hypothetical protein
MCSADLLINPERSGFTLVRPGDVDAAKPLTHALPIRDAK